jgi:hypothetical protein
MGALAKGRDLAAVALLDEVILQPGGFGYFDPRKPPKAMPDFTLIPRNGFRRSWETVHISRGRFLRLRAQRTGVVQELRLRLDSIGPLCAQNEDYRRLLELYLGIVLDLNASEALPELLQMEERMSPAANYKASGGFSQHQELLSVILALVSNEGLLTPQEPVYYHRAERDQIVAAARRLVKSHPELRAASGMRKDPKDW